MEAEVLGKVADAPSGFCIASRLAEDARLTTRRRNQAEQDLDGGRLAGAIRAEEAKHLSGLDDEVQPVKRYLAAVLLAKRDRLDCGRQRSVSQRSVSATRLRSLALSEPARP